MKRSRRIKLVLIGTLSAGALTACDPNPSAPLVTADRVYVNNFYVPGVGYYHAPFRGFFPRPYNDFDGVTKRYFFGGQWAAAPHQSFTNISSPTPEMVSLVEANRTDVSHVSRGGFGSSSHSYHTWS
ncbi:MAG: hypothetical protein RLY20_969 [Verrucomicrobiota bacterium]